MNSDLPADGSSIRAIRHTIDGGGRKVALVPLGRRADRGNAIIDEADLILLEILGLSLRWNRHPRTGVVFAPAGYGSGGNVQVARVLLDCGPGENVCYLNGDPTDLRRDNLDINPDGYAIRRDRDFLTPPEKRRQWGPAIGHVYDEGLGSECAEQADV